MDINLQKTYTGLVCLIFSSLLLAACSGASAPQPGVTGAQPQPQPRAPEKRSLIFSAFLDEALGFDIYRINSDGSGLTSLANNPARDMYPAWSPDGKQVAFCSDRDGKNALYLMNADGSNQQLLSDAIDDCGLPSWDVPAWSPDGKWISISTYPEADFPNGKADVFLINPETAQVTNLTNNPANDSGAVWSPDSWHVLFISDRDGNEEIYRMKNDGNGLTRLTDNPARDGSAGWSPDGKLIVFISNRDGNFEIYMMSSDGSQVNRLTDNPGPELSPAWSPAGDAIAFTTDRDGNIEIYRMHPDGSEQTNLTNSPGNDYWFFWSPDGQSIAFTTCLEDCSGQQSKWNSSVMQSDGSKVVELLQTSASFTWQP